MESNAGQTIEISRCIESLNYESLAVIALNLDHRPIDNSC